MSVDREREYVLGTHDVEVERLGLQHRVWRPRVLDVARRAGLTIGHTTVDLGCGPGYATLDFADIVGPAGHVHAIDQSGRFLSVLKARAAAQGIVNVTTYERDLDAGGWPELQADFVWCRWVAAFVRQPRTLVDRIRDIVKPGGRVVMHEYLDYAGWRLMPDAPLFDEFVGAVIAAWHAAGGEPNIGRELPAWLESTGFVVNETRPMVDVITPSDFIWQWPRAFVDSGLSRLVGIGALSAARAEEIRRDFAAREASPHVRMTNPTVLEIVATRRH